MMLGRPFLPVLLVLSVAFPASAKPFRVAGLYSSPTESFSIDSYGQEMNCITKASVEDAARRGIQITYQQLDTKRDPITIATYAKKIAENKTFDAVVGTIVSGESVAAAKALGNGGIPFISPSGTHPDITRNNPFALRIPFDDDRQASLLAKLTYGELHPKRISVIRNASNLYSQFLSKEYQKDLKEIAPGIVVSEHVIIDDFKDFEGLAKKIAEEGSDLVFAPLWEPQVASLYTFLAKTQNRIIFLASDSIDGRPEFIKVLGPLSPNIRFIFSNYWNGRIEGPLVGEYLRLRDKFCRKYPISRVSIVAFDAITLVIKAVEKGTTRNRGEFVQRMKDLKLQGLAGPLVFDSSNNPDKPLEIFEIHGPSSSFWKEYR